MMKIYTLTCKQCGKTRDVSKITYEHRNVRSGLCLSCGRQHRKPLTVEQRNNISKGMSAEDVRNKCREGGRKGNNILQKQRDEKYNTHIFKCLFNGLLLGVRKEFIEYLCKHFRRADGWRYSYGTNDLKHICSSPEYRRKQRERVNKLLKVRGYAIRYNPTACALIDRWNEASGSHYQHALNGGEYYIDGYYVDGFDSGSNSIFEYDESYHNSSKYRRRDLMRQNDLITAIHPSSFIRYKENTGDVVYVL